MSYRTIFWWYWFLFQCLLFLSIQVVFSPYLTLSGLIIIGTSLLLGCLLSDTYSILFNVVIMLSSLLSRMLIYILLLLSIMVTFYNLFGKVHHISVKFYPLSWPQPLGFSLPSLNLSCSFVNTKVSILLFTLMISWSWFTLSGQAGGHFHFCVLYWFTLDYTLIFQSLTFTSLRLFLIGLC